MKSSKQISAKQEACKNIEKTIKQIKIQYKDTEKKIQASGIPHLIVDATSLIKAECERNKVKEDAVRRIAGWESLRTGNSRINTNISQDEDS